MNCGIPTCGSGKLTCIACTKKCCEHRMWTIAAGMVQTALSEHCPAFKHMCWKCYREKVLCVLCGQKEGEFKPFGTLPPDAPKLAAFTVPFVIHEHCAQPDSDIMHLFMKCGGLA